MKLLLIYEAGDSVPTTVHICKDWTDDDTTLSVQMESGDILQYDNYHYYSIFELDGTEIDNVMNLFFRPLAKFGNSAAHIWNRNIS